MAATLHVFVTGAGYKWPGYVSYLSFPPLKFEDIPAGTLGSWAALPQVRDPTPAIRRLYPTPYPDPTPGTSPCPTLHHNTPPHTTPQQTTTPSPLPPPYPPPCPPGVF